MNDRPFPPQGTASAIETKSSSALFFSASLALQNGDLTGAVEIFQRLVALDPNNRRAAAQLALTLARLGRISEAYPVLKNVAPWHDSPNIELLFLQAAIATGALDDAQIVLAALEKVHPDDVFLLLCRAQLNEARGCPLEAVAALKRAVELSGDNPEIVMGLGSVAFRAGDKSASEDAVARAFRQFSRAPGNQELADWLTAALIKLRRIEEAENCAFSACEANVDLAIVENSRVERLIAQERHAEAVTAVMKAIVKLSPMRQPGFQSPARRFTMPITRLVIHNGHQLMRFADAEDIASACGCPVMLTDLYTVRPEQYASPGSMIIFTGGIETIQGKRILEIERIATSCPVVAWLQDNHHCYLWNALVVEAADISFPAQSMLIDYLTDYTREQQIGPVIPTGLFQWPRAELACLYQELSTETRSNALFGKFGFHHVAHRRNLFINQIAQAWPASEVGFSDVSDYCARSARERFLTWRRYKTSITLPLGHDLSMRFFDSLSAGHVPIVPRDIIGFDRVISPEIQAALPVVRLSDYSIEAVRTAHAEAIAAFDSGGEDAAFARHKFVLDNHMLAHRIAEIVNRTNTLLGLSFSQHQHI